MTAPADEPFPPGAKFPLGRVVITPSAALWLPAQRIEQALRRHQAGDWGDVGPDSEIARDNAEALRRGFSVFSFYFRRMPEFRIITSGDRSQTTVSTFRDH